MANQLYMVVEYFKNKDAVPVYRRFRDQGRMLPEGLVFVSSWVDLFRVSLSGTVSRAKLRDTSEVI